MRPKAITSISSSELPGRITWIILSRVITYGLLFAASVVFLSSNSILYRVMIAYGILAIGFLLYLFFTKSRLNDKLVNIIIGVQLIFEFAIESILVNHAGGNFSPLIVLFLLSIVSATLVYGLLVTLLAATVAGVLYAVPIIYDFSNILPGVLEANQLTRMGYSSDEAFYTIFLHLCMFYLIAFISGYVAENQISATRQLRKIKLETDEILENMSSGMLSVDSSRKLAHFNKAAADILGVNHKLARNASYKSVLLSKFPELYYKIELAMTTGYTESRSEITIRVNHESIPLGISTSVLRDEQGEIRGVIAVFQNLAEVKLMEKRLRDADRLAAIGQLSAGIAHEIRNPLASISGSVEVLKNSLVLSDTQDMKLLELILKESSRLNEILTEFLSFARIKSNPDTTTDIGPVITEVLVLAESHSRHRDNIKISYLRPEGSLHGRGSPEMYKQLLWNLILNSFEAIGDRGGELTISCSRHIEKNGRVWTKLTVADNGPGIPANYRDKIFNPFFSSKTDGTGMGLAIVARIVESLEGKIEFTTGDSGTKFDIYLPVGAYQPIRDLTKNQVLKAD
jgi:two-component system sensor histidine kinase PilS (NtrC family)